MTLPRLTWPLAAALLALAAWAAPTAAPAAAPRTVKVLITEEGPQPAAVDARAGEPLRLEVTRKTDATCVTRVVMKEFGVSQDLPLNKPVTVELTPKKAGAYVAKCGMGMDVVTLNVK